MLTEKQGAYHSPFWYDNKDAYDCSCIILYLMIVKNLKVKQLLYSDTNKVLIIVMTTSTNTLDFDPIYLRVNMANTRHNRSIISGTSIINIPKVYLPFNSDDGVNDGDDRAVKYFVENFNSMTHSKDKDV